MNDPDDTLPRSVAIAGAWGYVGRKFLDVAVRRGLTAYAFDPGPRPADVDPDRVVVVPDAETFDRAPAELFHLAVHPEHRRLEPLLARRDPPLVLNEKPMAAPEDPDGCDRVVRLVEASRGVVLFDFPELFDPLTARLFEALDGLPGARVTGHELTRSKDREDPANPRNFKRMVTIQYQESVHCLAFALFLLARQEGGVAASQAGGLRVEAEAEPYVPPNPEAYPLRVDGRCRFRLGLGGVSVVGDTNFRRGAPWAKRRVIRGTTSGRPFEIEASYLEGDKWLKVNGEPVAFDPGSCSYENVLRTFTRWSRAQDRRTLLTGLFPHPRFTRMTSRLSSALWRASYDRGPLHFPSAEVLEGWDAGYADEHPRLRVT